MVEVRRVVVDHEADVPIIPYASSSNATLAGESDGCLGMICIYEASSPEKIREHAFRPDMPATELRGADTVVVRPDPVPAAT